MSERYINKRFPIFIGIILVLGIGLILFLMVDPRSEPVPIATIPKTAPYIKAPAIKQAKPKEPKLISVSRAQVGSVSVRLGQRSDEVQDSLMPYIISDNSAGFVVGGILTATYEDKGIKHRIVYGPNNERGDMGVYEVSKIYKLVPN